MSLLLLLLLRSESLQLLLLEELPLLTPEVTPLSLVPRFVLGAHGGGRVGAMSRLTHGHR